MIATTAYILISTILSNNGTLTQSTTTFADKASCEKVAVRQDFVLKALETHYTKWNFTCHPYSLSEEKK
jgi:inorganic pyrophosphatase/exopolyphosphatase